MTRTTCPQLVIVLLALAAPLLAGPMEDENLYAVPESRWFVEPELIALLRQSAARPDAETRLETLEAIRDHRLADLADVVRSLMTDERDVVRISAIRAARAIGLKEAAPAIAEFARASAGNTPTQRDLIMTADAALAEWRDLTLAADWTRRVGDAQAPGVLRISAASALGEAYGPGGGPAMPADVSKALIAAAGDAANAPAVRFAAALAVAPQPGAQAAAVELLNGDLLDRLVGVRLIGAAPTAQAVAALQANARHDEPALQAAALRVLVDAGPDAAPFDLLSQAIASADPKVRQVAVEGVRLHPAPPSVTLAFAQLNDPHPDVRAAATDTLIQLAQTPALDDAIRRQLAASLGNMTAFDEAGQRRRWGEAEQLARLAGALDHKPVAVDVTRLYDFPRVEVGIAAVQAVRTLDVPETRPPTVRLMANLIDLSQRQAELMAGLDEAAANAFMEVLRLRAVLAEQTALTLGVWAEPAADPVLRTIIKKDHPIGAEARGAGIWALGRIHAGRPDNSLAGQLAGRLRDYAGMIPEADNVREQSAVAIGRMKAESQMPTLRNHFTMAGESYAIRAACRWAIGNITGELPEPIDVRANPVRDVFLTPLSR